jgi:hypothetical protein
LGGRVLLARSYDRWVKTGSPQSIEWAPVLTLLFVAPVVAELVGSGNLPTLYFLNPFIVLLFCAIYGPPALLLRELWVRGRVGWPSMLLLGFAFAALDEGVVANTWFKPHALEMSASVLGRAHGVNWNLVANLTIFHTFVSMFIAITLVQLWFGTRSPGPWLPRWAILTCVAVSTVVALGAISGEKKGKQHVPAANHDQRAATIALIVLIVLIALVLPRLRFSQVDRPVPTVGHVFAYGCIWSVAYLFLFFGVVRITATAAPLVALFFFAATVFLLVRWCGSSSWTARHTLWCCSGVLAVTMLTTVWRVFALQPLSSALFIWWLVLIDRRLAPRAVP